MTQSGSQQPEEKPDESQEKIGHQEEYKPSEVYEHIASDVYFKENPESGEREDIAYKDDIIKPSEDEKENGKNN